MNFDLTDEQKNIQRLARDFAQQEVKPVAEELDRTKSFPYEIVGKLAELGLMGMPFPEEYGGAARGHDRAARFPRSTAAPVPTTSRMRSRSRSSDASIRASRSRSPRTRRSAPGRFTRSAPRSRSTSGCRSSAPAGSSGASG